MKLNVQLTNGRNFFDSVVFIFSCFARLFFFFSHFLFICRLLFRYLVANANAVERTNGMERRYMWEDGQNCPLTGRMRFDFFSLSLLFVRRFIFHFNLILIRSNSLAHFSLTTKHTNDDAHFERKAKKKIKHRMLLDGCGVHCFLDLEANAVACVAIVTVNECDARDWIHLTVVVVSFLRRSNSFFCARTFVQFSFWVSFCRFLVFRFVALDVAFFYAAKLLLQKMLGAVGNDDNDNDELKSMQHRHLRFVRSFCTCSRVHKNNFKLWFSPANVDIPTKDRRANKYLFRFKSVDCRFFVSFVSIFSNPIRLNHFFIFSHFLYTIFALSDVFLLCRQMREKRK